MKKITIEDLGNIHCLSTISYSPDGTVLAYVVHQASLKENKYLSSIWVMENGVSRKLTTGDAESSFIWLDNENLLFSGDRKKAHTPDPGQAVTVYNKINIHGGEAEELFTVPMKCTSIRKVSEEEYLVVGRYDFNMPDLTGLEGDARKDAIAKIEEEKDYEVFDEVPFWVNGKGVMNKIRARLYLYNKADGQCKLLSPEYMNVAAFEYQKETDKVLFYGHEYQWLDDQMDDMYVVDLHSGKTLAMGLNHEYRVKAANFVGDQVMIAGSKGERYSNNENPNYLLGDLETGKVTDIADLDVSYGSSVGSDCRHGASRNQKSTADAWYHLETIGYNSYIVKVTKDGKKTVVSPEIIGSVDGFDYFNGQFVYIGMRKEGLQEIYTCKEGAQEETKLTGFNDAFLAEHSICPTKHLTFVDTDGVEIDGWVIEPVDYDPNKTYPAILDVHGGPKSDYGENFFHEMQLWANEGYFVFFCNPRGSNGKGNEFADIRGPRYGVVDYNDIMEFTDLVLKTYPQIDQARVGMTGGSYGGFMANWMAGHTDRFAAIASQRSISNYFSKCLTTDIGYYHNLNSMQADPWKNPEDLWHHSPLKYADKCKTPMLFIQSDEDYRCWMADALQMFTALRMHGCPTRLCLFHGENHELSRNGKPKHRARRLKEITDWFDQYLKQ